MRKPARQVRRGTTGDQKCAICVACDGTGQVRKSVNYPGSVAGYYAQCRHCEGKGIHYLFGKMRKF